MKKIGRIAFAGGGSGGHVYPLIAVADEVRKRFPEVDIFFISTKGSIEERIIPKSTYPLVLIPSGKLKGQSLGKSILTLISLPISFLLCLCLILKRKPDYVFSAGGYAGAPYLVTAAILGIPCAILEQNRIPGMANRWMAKFCRFVFVNFDGSKECFPGKKVYVVGHPYRKEIESARWAKESEGEHWKRNPFHIFVFGGSQGAVGINRLVAAALPELKDISIFIHHQTGQLDYNNVAEAYKAAAFVNARIEQYVIDMTSAYRDAHLVICRAGASSIAELAIARKAALLIPLVSKDQHQEFNAKEMADRSAAAFSLQQELTGSKLAAMIKEFYYDRKKLQVLAAEMGKMNNEGAAEKIASTLFSEQV